MLVTNGILVVLLENLCVGLSSRTVWWP